MRFLKALSVAVVLLCTVALASESLGIHNTGSVKFETAVRVGATVIPAGEYTVRHTMEGQDHIMTFTSPAKKAVYKVKCSLVPLDHKAKIDQQTIQTSGNERVLEELVFRGDTAKHVF
jgi:hypothetical protein